MKAAMARWQDWAAVVIGVVVALSPMWMDTNNAARWSMVVLGVLVAVAGLAHMMSSEMAFVPWAMGALGVLMFLSPWVMGFADMAGAAWTSWIGGVLTALTAMAAMPEGSRLHIGHGGGLATHH
ncbi:SPW repeat protein [Rhodococcus sp. NPDC058514]|uniref:SPW repeat protein n=1 Tax=unclassified Rhodococcus (in: high G+C Gram-positive bacteria) TaxID=192944 RepID=UPI0036521AE0